MKKHKKLAITSVIVSVLLVGLLAVSYQSNIWPQAKVELGLPYTDEDPPTGMAPMGETINHAEVEGGHPGIDFQWDHPAKLISSFDGTVTDIYETFEKGSHQWNVDIQNGKYLLAYKELGEYNQDLKIGDSVETGDYIGTPHDTNPNTSPDERKNYQLHWEFGYAKIFIASHDKLCPTPYLNDENSMKLEDTWQAANYRDRELFPELCNDIYAIN